MRGSIKYRGGDIINGLTYLRDASPYTNPVTGKKARKAFFKCPYCESEFDTMIKSVKVGDTKSCGCASNKIGGETRTTHGLSYHPIYAKWIAIKERCFNVKNHNYKYYGGRGIAIHKPWVNDLGLFYDYVSALPYYGIKGLTLDRIDNDGDYEPGNMRWVTQHTQITNRRKNSNNTSGFVGVRITPSNKWLSNICVHGREIHLGIFKNILDAVNARNEYIIRNNLLEYKLQRV